MTTNTKNQKNSTRHFESIFRSGKIKGFKAGDVVVRDYFRDKALETQLSRSPGKIIESASAKAHAVTKPTPGKMLMFQYDAKYKDVLPYWDKFPVIFPIELYKDSYLGINMHYLPPVHRIRLMDALYENVNNKKYDETTKLKINYQILNSAAKFRYFKPCIKKYLYSHVKSQLVEVPIDEWDYVCFLPIARFQKASQRKVWDNVVQEIMKG